ncbi:hypothetical protein CO174_00730 [Candidatus Uhrbacteria bacterium CG_4_9_14_3_um_filter_50_9]|uniref:CYTH domain-containing protein n=1 Tax=Candidatus Uhrbacteria bacterium CG_4_9_14_3_um_filter_50_9 TaxID=1975035 RepID=A0A2M7XE42_9BACT|nr:MAG: hypothetical protein CO174_00730 [Candidatus Uhrbacteria bacterium CG_4_9_14_3_um_filter_50_9]
MIEVEKKYRLDDKQEKILTEGATFLKEVENVDEYFDTDDWSLTTQDHWLRKRNGAFELKKRLHTLGHKLGTTAYDELTDTEEIRAFLHLPKEGSFEDALSQAGYKRFVTLPKKRRSYERDGFRIDLDECPFDYKIAEIELLIDDPSKREEASERIDAFAASIGLDTSPVRGKIIEYLNRYSPNHYQALLDAGVIY